MSSHHFVKEGQEPALFIVDGISFKQIESLLEWSPMILVLDSVLEVVFSWGIKIDAVLVLQDKFDLITERMLEQMPVEIFSYQTGENPLTVGLKILSERQKAVHVIVEINEEVFGVGQLYVEKMDIVFMTKDVRWIYVNSGNFTKWLPSNAKLILRSNVNYDFNTVSLKSIDKNIMESISSGIVTIESDKPFWVGEFFNYEQL